MTNSKSAKKRIKVNRRNKIQNSSYKSSIKTSKKECLRLASKYRQENESTPLSIKSFLGSKDQAENSNSSSDIINDAKLKEAFILATSRIDKAVKKKVIHKNTGARKKSNLLKSLSFELETKK